MFQTATTDNNAHSNLYGTTGGVVGYGTVTGSVSSGGDDVRRPKPVFFWTNGEVMKWLKRCCEEFYELYGAVFLDNEITGRSLIRINEETLVRMGVDNADHREQITRIILKLKLKSDMIEIKDLERKATNSNANNAPTNTNTLPKASSKTFSNTNNYLR